MMEKKWGVSIEYRLEKKAVGTGGSLGLLIERPCKPFIVMNGDLITKINFQQLLDFHMEHGPEATMCAREYNNQIPYGVLEIEGHRIISVEEKPIQRYLVNAGIYVLNPKVLDLIPVNSHIDMPDVINRLIDKNLETAVFPIREYWADIGMPDDFYRVNNEYKENFE